MALSVSNTNVVSFDNKHQQSNVTQKARFNNRLQNDTVSFSSDKEKKQYENPVNKNMEYFSASVVPIVTSLVVGAGAHVLSGENGVNVLGKNITKNRAGVYAGLAALALTLPVALYHRSVSAFAKQKEMSVYSREKEAEIALSGKVDEKAHDEDVDLDDAIKTYTNFEIGRNGRAVGIVNT